jgi:hypothetical protein
VDRYGRVRIYSLFRIVPGDVFIREFASDRSHMVSVSIPSLPLPSIWETRQRVVHDIGTPSPPNACSFIRSRYRDSALSAQCRASPHPSSVRRPFPFNTSAVWGGASLPRDPSQPSPSFVYVQPLTGKPAYSRTGDGVCIISG